MPRAAGRGRTTVYTGMCAPGSTVSPKDSPSNSRDSPCNSRDFSSNSRDSPLQSPRILPSNSRGRLTFDQLTLQVGLPSGELDRVGLVLLDVLAPLCSAPSACTAPYRHPTHNIVIHLLNNTTTVDVTTLAATTNIASHHRQRVAATHLVVRPCTWPACLAGRSLRSPSTAPGHRPSHLAEAAEVTAVASTRAEVAVVPWPK